MSRQLAPLLLVLGLAACGRGEEGRGALSSDQERGLDNAARMLDENMVFDTSPEALNENLPTPPRGNGQ